MYTILNEINFFKLWLSTKHVVSFTYLFSILLNRIYQILVSLLSSQVFFFFIALFQFAFIFATNNSSTSCIIFVGGIDDQRNTEANNHSGKHLRTPEGNKIRKQTRIQRTGMDMRTKRSRTQNEQQKQSNGLVSCWLYTS